MSLPLIYVLQSMSKPTNNYEFGFGQIRAIGRGRVCLHDFMNVCYFLIFTRLCNECANGDTRGKRDWRNLDQQTKFYDLVNLNLEISGKETI